MEKAGVAKSAQQGKKSSVWQETASSQPIGGAQKHNAAFATFQTLVKDGIPLTSFGVDNTCGNLIQIAAKK